MPNNKGKFITIEGIEGVGKSTAVKFIQTYLAEMGKKFIVTREPGGTVIAEQIRKILLTPNDEENITADTELLLMFACRSQHIATKIKPALLNGDWVVSDRFIDASYAYQGAGRTITCNHIKMLDHWIVADLQPDITILLDAPPKLGLARAKRRGAQDRIEQETVMFFEKVREGYLARANEFPHRFRVIDATTPLHEVHNKIRLILDELI